MNHSIFEPAFDIDSATISAAIEECDRHRWLIDNMLLMPKHETWIRRNVSVQRASGTTRIEGASMDEAAVDKLIRKGHTAKLSEDEEDNLNALRAYEFIDYISDQGDIPLDELVIRQLNREFIRTAAATLTPGVYRHGQNTVGGYTPPDQGDVPGLMRSFALWLRSTDEIHPILKAGIAHIHLVAIHPFWDGNGRTARGLATLMLQRSEFSFRKLLSLEAALFTRRDEYFDAIDRTLGTHFQPNYDVTSWLVFFTTTLTGNATELSGTLRDWHRMMSEAQKTYGQEMSTRQVEGYVFAERAGHITRPEYMEITGASAVTASRDLAGLVRIGRLVPVGNTRSRVYYPGQKESEPERSQNGDQLKLI